MAVENIQRTFEHDTEIICRKVPRLRPLVKKRASVMHENCGFLYLRDDRTREARKEFRLAIRFNPRRGRSHLLFLLSLLGADAVNRLIRMKKRLVLRLDGSPEVRMASPGRAYPAPSSSS